MAKIKIFVDENVNFKIVKGLRRRGVEVITPQETGMTGKPDEQILEFAKKIKASVFTHDDDFLNIADKYIREGKLHYGVIYVHQKKLSIGEIIRRLKLLVEVMDSEDMKNHIEFL